MTPDLDAADCLAPEILAFLAGEADRLQRFLDLTGLTPQSIRRAAAQPGFADSLLDYLCGDDRLLLAFAADSGHEPAKIEAIRQHLVARRGEAG